MRNAHFILAIVLQVLIANFSNAQVTVFPHGLSQRTLQVHDSISPFTEFKITHGLNTGQGIKMRMYSLGEADLHNRLGDLILKSGATGPGAHMVLEEFGNIGIGYPRFSATHALHIKDTDPLRLQGLTNNLTYDTVLVVSPSGVLHKRAQNTFPASYWIKSGNYVFNNTDSIGIGISSPSERLHVADAIKVGSSTKIARLNLESVFVESEFGQYKYGTSDLLLDGTLPASGLTYIKAKAGSSDVVSSQGLLLEVEGAKPMIFANNDEEVMRIHSNGYLGIGTKIPTEPLSVDSSMIVGKIIKLGTENHIQLGRFLDPFPNKNDLNIHAPHNIQLATFNDVEFVDSGSGNEIWAEFDNANRSLNIDTTNSYFSLHVNGDASIEDSLIVPKIVLGPPADERYLISDGGGIKIQNNSTAPDVRSNITMSNGSGHFMTMDEGQFEYVYGSRSYLKFDGPTRRISINGATSIPRETLDVTGNALVTDSIYVSGFSKIISGKAGALEVSSDEPINITADLSNVTISDGIFPYAIFDGRTRNFGLLNSGSVDKKLVVGGSGLFYDSIFVKTLGNNISTTSSDQFKMESDKDILLSPAANRNLVIQRGSSTFAIFQGSTERVGIGTSSPQETLEVNGTIETDKIKITDGAIPGRVLVSDGDGLGSWGTVPPDGDWTVTGMDMQSGVPGNIQVGVGIAQNSKWNVNGSIAKSIKVVAVPTYTMLNNDYTVVLADPSPVMTNLPEAATCPGRIYKIKFLTPGGSLVPFSAADLIDNAPGTFAVPPPAGGIATTITIQSDGGNGWWILN